MGIVNQAKVDSAQPVFRFTTKVCLGPKKLTFAQPFTDLLEKELRKAVDALHQEQRTSEEKQTEFREEIQRLRVSLTLIFL